MFRINKRWVMAAGLAILIAMAGASLAWAQTAATQPESRARQAVSPTSVQLQFPTATATPGPPTETPTRTATSQGRPWVEALADSTNVRAGPDINEARVGQIFPGTQYTVLGKRFQWYWIEYPDTPSGRAWIHESVVELGGDLTQIQNLEEIPTTAPELEAAQGTALAITETPGLAATLTAEMLVTPQGIFTPQGGQAAATLAPGQSLPTFTFPPFTPTPVAIPRQNPPPETGGGLAPILPILTLGALGLMGLLVAILRRA